MELSSPKRRKRHIPSLKDLVDLARAPIEIDRAIEHDVLEVRKEHVDRMDRLFQRESESAEMAPQSHLTGLEEVTSRESTAGKKKSKLHLPAAPWKHTAEGRKASLDIADKFGDPIFDSSRPYDEEVKTTNFIVHAANAIFALAKKEKKDPLEMAISLEMRTRNEDREMVLRCSALRSNKQYSQWPMAPKSCQNKKIGTHIEKTSRKKSTLNAPAECPHRAFEASNKLRCFDPQFKENLLPPREWLREWCLGNFRKCPVFLGLGAYPPKKSDFFEN